MIKNKSIFENYLLPLLLIFLLLPMLSGIVFQYDLRNSGLLSLDKIFRMCVIFFGSFVVLSDIVFKRVYDKFFCGYFLIPVSVFFISYFSQYIISDFGSIYQIDSSKETLRIFFILIFLLLASRLAVKREFNLIFFLVCVALIGFVSSIFAVYYSCFASISQNWRMVAGFVRAGDVVTDSNLIGAYLVMCSIVSIGCYLYFDLHKSRAKYFFVISFLASFIARVFTFSNGSLVNLFVSFICFFVLYYKFISRKIIKVVPYIFIFLFLMIGWLFYSGYWEIIFHRAYLGNAYARYESLGSRLEQYLDIITYFSKEPFSIFLGIGVSGMRDAIYSHAPVHNSFLKVFTVGGIPALLSYIYIIMRTYRIFFFVMSSSDCLLKIFSLVFISSFTGWLVQSQTLPADTEMLNWFYISIAVVLYGNSKKSYYDHIISK